MNLEGVKKRRTETRFGPDFITTFLTEDFDIDTLNDELVSIYLIEEDPKTYDEALKFNRCNIFVTTQTRAQSLRVYQAYHGPETTPLA